MWPEVEAVKSENKRELNLTGEKFTELLDKSDGKLDESVFELKQLNFLSLTNSQVFCEISDEIQKLENLQSLLLFGNRLKKLPASIESLHKLKILDVSKNQLTEFNFDLSKMDHLGTINLSGNEIASFNLKSQSVHVLDLSQNKISQFPEIPTCVMELKINKNQITEIPGDIQLPNLKNLDMSDNQITGVPKTLGGMKLKVLNLKQNPLKDKKLHKFIEQNQALKAIMDHISKLGISTPAPTTNGTVEKHPEPVTPPKSQQIIIKKNDESFKIMFHPSVKEVRNFILCCIISDVEFTTASLKEFLQFQTKLHDGVCKKRELATIATHDFDKIPTKNLKYTAKHKDEIGIQPLGRHKSITATEYYNNLKAEAEAIRKEKKRSQFTGIHKFLHLLDGQENFALLETDLNVTLSLPPLTNSEITKLSSATKKILVEVTSSANQAICNQIMSTLLGKALELNMSSSPGKLDLEQVRINNVDNNLKTLFPSKTDLKEFESAAEIIRP